MIAKGNLCADGGQLAGYLINGDENEIAELLETRGLEYFGRDPVEAFETLEKIADENTRSTKPFFHTQTRNPDGDKKLTDAEWLEIVDREEKQLGFEGQPRIVAFHIDKATGEKHMHAAWFRIDLETMRAIDPGLFKNHLKELSRALEKEYGLQEISSVRKPEDIARIADRKEVEESRRLGMDVREVRNAILNCLERTDNGKAFRAALDEHGLMLSNGDRRDCFVVIDQAGGQHALNKKLTGLTLEAMRDRLGDLDRMQLPSVEQAKAMQQEKYPTPELAREAWDLSQERLRNMPGHYDPLRPESASPRDERPAQTEPRTAVPQEPRWQERAETKLEKRIDQLQTEAPKPGAAPLSEKLFAEGVTFARVDKAGKEAIERGYAQQFENAQLQDIKDGTNTAKLRQASFQEGEFVAVTKWGNVHRLNPRLIDLEKVERATTGGGDLTPTLSAALENRWQQRDETKLEKRIGELQMEPGGASIGGKLFAEGITFARVDKAGKEEVAREHGRQFENDKLQDIKDGTDTAKLRPVSFKEGEFVAVTKWGGVHRINPRFIDIEKLERTTTGGGDKTPTLSVAREDCWQKRDETKLEKRIGALEKDAARPGGPTLGGKLHAEGVTFARVDKAGKEEVERDYARQYANAQLQDIKDGTNTAKLRQASFKEGEFVAVTKWGGVHRLNPRFMDIEKLERATTGSSDKTPTLSDARENFATDRQRQKDDRAAGREIRQEFKAEERSANRFDEAIRRTPGEAVKGAARAGLKMMDTAGKVVSFSSFLENFFGMGTAPHSSDQQQAPQGYGGADHDYSDAMESIAENVARGENLSAEAVRNLPPAEWENLRSHGDAWIQTMIRDFEIEKEVAEARSWEEYDHERMGRER